MIAHLPRVELSPADSPLHAGEARFVRDYASIGQLAATLLHRRLVDGKKGVPANEQTVLVSSFWEEAPTEAGRTLRREPA